MSIFVIALKIEVDASDMLMAIEKCNRIKRVINELKVVESVDVNNIKENRKGE